MAAFGGRRSWLDLRSNPRWVGWVPNNSMYRGRMRIIRCSTRGFDVAVIRTTSSRICTELRAPSWSLGYRPSSAKWVRYFPCLIINVRYSPEIAASGMPRVVRRNSVICKTTDPTPGLLVPGRKGTTSPKTHRLLRTRSGTQKVA